MTARGIFEHSHPVTGSSPGILGGVLVLGICVVLAFSVVAFGSAEYWAMCSLQVASAALLVLWATTQLSNSKPVIVWTPLFAPVFLLALVIAVQLLGHSVYWYATWLKTIQWLSYAMLFFLAVQTIRGERRSQLFGLFLVCFGSLVALIAIAQSGTESEKLFWLFPTDSHSVLYGPYPNHAHYAGLMEMLLPFPLIFGLSSLFRSHAKILLLFVALVMAGLIFLAASFGGILSLGGELVVLAILLLRRRKRHAAVQSMLVLLLVLAVVVVILQPVVLQERLEHLRGDSERMDVAVRLWIVRDSIRMIWQRPLLGYGLGNFVEVFPSFRTFYMNQFVNAAHNDYVQAMVEIGTIGFVAIASLVVLLFREALRKSANWEYSCEGSVALAALVGCSGMLIHSFCDFNLQVPANAALFAVIAGVAVTRRSGQNKWERRSVGRVTALAPAGKVR